MPDAIHPRSLTTFKIRINNSDPVVDFLQGQSVFGGGKDGLADEGCIRQVGFPFGIWAWRESIGKLIVLVLFRSWSDWAWRGYEVDGSSR
jgi:hypothetical protein